MLSAATGHLEPPVRAVGRNVSDDVVAAAMIDRLVHHAEVLTPQAIRNAHPGAARTAL
jgi:hypothetical protein